MQIELSMWEAGGLPGTSEKTLRDVHRPRRADS
jgi:hypothetical protein